VTSVVRALRDGAVATRRLSALVPLEESALLALQAAARRGRLVEPRTELQREGAPVRERLLILRGWAARTRVLEDGRRQIMSFLLPGDLIGNCHHESPLAVAAAVSLTHVEACPAPEGVAGLGEAYLLSSALEEAYLLAQITRLGRLNAEERLVDLLLELLERMQLCGLASNNGFDFPLTQEMIADMTGLTAVHVNRMLQLLRRQGDITLKAGHLAFENPAGLADRVGRSPVIVSERQRGGGRSGL
jgi:CRP-like cAMP-binding protein